MKKLVIFLLGILLISTFVLAAENETPTDKIAEIKDEVSNIKLGDIGNATKEKTESVLEKKFTIPEGWLFIYQITIGGVGGTNEISWEEIIVRILIAVFIFIIALEILGFTAFETKWVKFIMALGISILFTIGGMNEVIYKTFHLITSNFWIIAGVLIGLYIISYILGRFFGGIKKQQKISKAHELGIKAGASLKGLSKTTETAASVAKEE